MPLPVALAISCRSTKQPGSNISFAVAPPKVGVPNTLVHPALASETWIKQLNAAVNDRLP